MAHGKILKIPDSASYLSSREEIFDQQIYRFNTSNSKPYIVDCGANIGLSIIYFKQLFPNAEIVAFEPDEKIFNAFTIYFVPGAQYSMQFNKCRT